MRKVKLLWLTGLLVVEGVLLAVAIVLVADGLRLAGDVLLRLSGSSFRLSVVRQEWVCRFPPPLEKRASGLTAPGTE